MARLTYSASHWQPLTVTVRDDPDSGNGDDLMEGEAGDDKIQGYAGNDTLNGGNGYDRLWGGAGDDYMDGGDAFDTAAFNAPYAVAVTVDLSIAGPQDTGHGFDTLSNIENLFGTFSDDILKGNSGLNTLEGWSGNDTLSGEMGHDALDGGDGIDTATYASAPAGVSVRLDLSSPQDTGSVGSDTLLNIENLVGSDDTDELIGSAENNLLDGGLADDTLSGGTGNDTYVLADVHKISDLPLRFAFDRVIEVAGEGIDTVMVQRPGPTNIVTTYWLEANVENGIVTGADFFTLHGNELDNNLRGNTAANTLNGAEGRDSLQGSEGNDIENGGSGRDTVGGGKDDDTLFGGAGNDSVMGGYGNDSIYGGSAIGDTAVEADTLSGGEGDDFVQGNGGNDKVFGTAGNDTVSGGAGSDAVEGGTDNDQVNGGDGNDTLAGGLGLDTLTSGIGSDIHDYNLVGESGVTAETCDRIVGFATNVDRIDLSNIDAVPGGNNNPFAFIGTLAFTAEGQVRVQQSGADTIVAVNTVGTGSAEMMILLIGITATTLDAGEFVL